jgi:hypothetical protein
MFCKRRLVLVAIIALVLVNALAFALADGYSRIQKGMTAEQVIRLVGQPTGGPITDWESEMHRWATTDGEFCISFRHGVVDSKQYYVWKSRYAALENWWSQKWR